MTRFLIQMSSQGQRSYQQTIFMAIRSRITTNRHTDGKPELRKNAAISSQLIKKPHQVNNALHQAEVAIAQIEEKGRSTVGFFPFNTRNSEFWYSTTILSPNSVTSASSRSRNGQILWTLLSPRGTKKIVINQEGNHSCSNCDQTIAMIVSLLTHPESSYQERFEQITKNFRIERMLFFKEEFSCTERLYLCSKKYCC